MNELISVIVPIYNVDKYLKRCIDSIINQTYENLEIILIDDGSNDNSSNICDEYGKKDNRIIVIHKQNGGLSSARNLGLLTIKGNYVSFVDSDDWVHPNFIAYLYNSIKENNSQIVECLFKKTTYSNLDVHKLKYTELKSKNFFGDECFIEFIRGNTFKQTVWNKLYRFKLIENILFEEGKSHEDEFWTYQVFSKAERVTYLNYVGYYYFQRDESIMGLAFSQRNMDGFEAKCKRLDYVKDNYPIIYQEELVNFSISCIYFYTKIYENKFSSKQKYLKLVKRNYKKAFKSLNLDEITFKRKMWLISFLLIPDAYCLINKKFNFVESKSRK